MPDGNRPGPSLPRPGPWFPPRPPSPQAGHTGGFLSSLLGRLDAEDLLILAILLLALKEDGADRTVLLIAAALYLFGGPQRS